MLVAKVAMEANGLGGMTGAVNETVLLAISSVILVIGALVLVDAHDKEFGLVKSVKEVLFPVPGKGNPAPFMTPYDDGGSPVALAQTGYSP